MFTKKICLILGVFFSFFSTFSFASPVDVTLNGKAGFEKRMTLIPLLVCNGSECPESKPYWTLVLLDEGIKYELDQPFLSETASPPEFIEINGVTVRQGARLLLTGKAQYISPTYALITDVHQVEVTGDINQSLY